MRKTFNIVLAEYAPLYREGIKLALKGNCCRFCFTEVSTIDALLELLQQPSGKVDLLLLDYKLLSATGLAELKACLLDYELPVLLTCDQLNPEYQRIICGLGIKGVIEKTTSRDEFRQAVMTLLRGESWLPAFMSAESSCISQRVSLLTKREHDVLQYLIDGLMNKQIAYQMGITEHTVKYHVSHILSKLQVSSRTGLVVSMHQKSHVVDNCSAF